MALPQGQARLELWLSLALFLLLLVILLGQGTWPKERALLSPSLVGVQFRQAINNAHARWMLRQTSASAPAARREELGLESNALGWPQPTGGCLRLWRQLLGPESLALLAPTPPRFVEGLHCEYGLQGGGILTYYPATGSVITNL
ncbi:hypothetical protein [Ferrimonas pelagia]|uniref:MSHA biogenesis protein MshF n=1 Tax=Ferrimonas pelagia TaxID=1177826 RepID=A0ABP9FIW6_9GAMM